MRELIGPSPVLEGAMLAPVLEWLSPGLATKVRDLLAQSSREVTVSFHSETTNDPGLYELSMGRTAVGGRNDNAIFGTIRRSGIHAAARISPARGNEASFASLARNAPVGMYRASVEGGVTFVNAEWCRATGVSLEDAIGSMLLERVHPDDQAGVSRMFAYLIAAKTGGTVKIRWLHPDGYERFFKISANCEIEADGSVNALAGILIDETDAELLDRKLRASEQQLALLAETSLDAILRLGFDGICAYSSPASIDVLGVEPDYLVGKQLVKSIHEADEAVIWKALRELGEGRSEQMTIEWRSSIGRQAGDYFWLEGNCRLVRDADNSPQEVVVSLRNIDSRKQIQFGLDEARTQAESLARTQTMILATMSHELRTPMNGVMGAADLLATTNLDPEQAGYVGILQRSSAAMMQLLDTVLQLSRVRASAEPIWSDVIDVHHFLNGLADELRVMVAGRPIEVCVFCDADVPDQVMGDTGKVRQILLNLATNAAKFTETGTIHLMARRSVAESGPMLEFALGDTGMGIAPDKIDAIFQPFVQADDSIHRKFGGTGLGLAIVKELVDALGGGIEVSSENGAGSTFKVVLPLELTGEEGISEASVQATEPSLRMNVLVVDDHPVNRLIVEAMLQKLGHQFVSVANGAAAVAAFQQRPEFYDLILMDLEMPELSGIEAATAIRRLGIPNADLPIFALTAHQDPGEAVGTIMQGKLLKPVSIDTLRGAIATSAQARARPHGGG
ncbi:MAG: ATP-binding protein [Novosphingobium sp.]